MRRWFAAAIMLVLAISLAGAGRPGSPHDEVTGNPDDASPMAGKSKKGPQVPASSRVVNDVVDLLDDPALLEEANDDVWESAIFSTERYRRIFLHVLAESENGSVACRVGWRFAPGDPFVYVHTGNINMGIVRPFEGGAREVQRRPEFPDLWVQTVPSSALWDPGEVRGLSARVRCVPYSSPGLGEDPTVIEPVVATLTDVKVLLRR
jgi:hypothetical protein